MVRLTGQRAVCGSTEGGGGRAGCDNPGMTGRRRFGWSGALPLLALALAVCLGRAARAEHGMYEPRFREGRPGDVLVAGTPGLLRGHVHAYVDLVEASFDLGLGAVHEQALRDALEASFTRWNSNDRLAFLELVTPIAGLREKGRAGDLAGLESGQRAFCIALDRRIQAAPREEPYKLVTQALERGQRALWKGVPAIRASAAEAWLEATLMLVGLGRNETYEPTPGQREALTQQLDLELHGQPEAVRERLRQFHRTWSLVKARWDAALPARRFLLRWEAVRLLARAMPRERVFEPKVGPEPTDYVREASVVAGRMGAYDAWSNLARQPLPTLEAFVKGLELAEPAPKHMLLNR